jgi:hypothetical protein
MVTAGQAFRSLQVGTVRREPNHLLRFEYPFSHSARASPGGAPSVHCSARRILLDKPYRDDTDKTQMYYKGFRTCARASVRQTIPLGNCGKHTPKTARDARRSGGPRGRNQKLLRRSFCFKVWDASRVISRGKLATCCKHSGRLE